MISKLNIRKFLTIVFLGIAVSSGAAVEAKKPKMTPMELQAIQSREFEVSKDVAFGAVMTVIQDLGYTVESADLASGFVTAASPTENKAGFFEVLGGMSASGNTVMTAFMLQMPNGMTRIRLNFVNSKSTSSAYGRDSRQDKPILDPAVYSNAWERIDEALFVMGAISDKSSAPQSQAPVATQDSSSVKGQSDSIADAPKQLP